MPRREEFGFDEGEAALEFGVGAANGGFGIGVEMARQIGDRKEKIADFGARIGAVAGIQGRFDFVCFFAELGENRAWIVPIESDGRRLVLQFDGARQSGQGERHIRQEGRCVRQRLDRPVRQGARLFPWP